MGIVKDFREFMTTRNKVSAETPEQSDLPTNSDSSFSIYENNAITVRGEPKGYDFGTILGDPQQFINRLYDLATYYKECDPYVGAAITNVYVPFSISDKYKLTGVDEATKAKYEAHYTKIGFLSRMTSIFDQYYTFSNVYVYLMPDASMYTLPPKRCRIAEVNMNGEPIVEFDTSNITLPLANVQGREDYLDDAKARLRGLPPEVAKALLDKDRKTQWVQLNPENVYVLQSPKPDWTRYAVPTISRCLNALSRKALIGDYEKAMLQFGIKGFLQVQVGDKEAMPKPDQRHINNAADSYTRALKGGQLVAMPWYVDSKFITVDTKTLFDKDKYAGVNQEILSAYGISGVISMGQQEAGSYGQAKLSLDTAALRIEWAQRNFEEMMNRINMKIAKRLKRVSIKDIPKFEFPRVDLTRDGKFQEVVSNLWMQGMISDATLLESYGLDIAQEFERRHQEAANGYEETFVPRQNAYTSNTSQNGAGRPKKDDSDRTSDPEKSETGAQPKPSNPDGSL